MNSPLPIRASSATRAAAWLTRWFGLATMGYVGAGIVAMWLLAPRVPYADQWRHFAHLLARPFPANILEADNGHPEVLPNLVRLIDLHYLGGHEWLQIGCGMLLALITTMVLLRRILADAALSGSTRAACSFAVAFGIFWFGNLRALTQPGDSVHVYMVMACLASALNLATLNNEAPRPGLGKVGLASVLCLIASFSFGSGIATFVGLIALLVLQRQPRTHIVVATLLLLVALGLYFALAGAGVAMRFAPVQNVVTALTLLGTPFVYLFWPLLDPAAAAAVPGPLHDVAVASANAWTALFGNVRRSVFPQACFGALAVGLLARLSLLAWKEKAATSTELGLALGWFGFAVSVLIALTRADYFLAHPDQIGAPRYVPWSMLAWSGILLAVLSQMRTPRRAVLLAMLLPLVALPSEIEIGMMGRHVRDIAEDAALYATVGVVPVDASLGETELTDLRTALPFLRSLPTAMFTWPEAGLLDARVSADRPDPDRARSAPLHRSVASQVETGPTPNALGDEPGSRVAAHFASPCAGDRIAIFAHDRAVGLLRRTADGTWRGVARGTLAAEQLTFEAFCP